MWQPHFVGEVGHDIDRCIKKLISMSHYDVMTFISLMYVVYQLRSVYCVKYMKL